MLSEDEREKSELSMKARITESNGVMCSLKNVVYKKAWGIMPLFCCVFYVRIDWGDKQVNDPRGYINTQKYVLMKNYKGVFAKLYRVFEVF